MSDGASHDGGDRTEQTTLSGKVVRAHTFAFCPESWPPLIFRERGSDLCDW